MFAQHFCYHPAGSQKIHNSENDRIFPIIDTHLPSAIVFYYLFSVRFLHYQLMQDLRLTAKPFEEPPHRNIRICKHYSTWSLNATFFCVPAVIFVSTNTGLLCLHNLGRIFNSCVLHSSAAPSIQASYSSRVLHMKSCQLPDPGYNTDMEKYPCWDPEKFVMVVFFTENDIILHRQKPDHRWFSCICWPNDKIWIFESHRYFLNSSIVRMSTPAEPFYLVAVTTLLDHGF